MQQIKHPLRFLAFMLISNLVVLISPVSAQGNEPPLFPQDQIPAGLIELTDKEIVLSYSVLIFGLIVLGLHVYLLRRVEATAQQILLAFTLTTIIIASLYLVTIGLSSEQIAPAFSLFGAIIGYLLGRESLRHEISPVQREEKNNKIHND